MNILEWIEEMFRSYGYFVLLCGLPLDFIALPIPPGQTTLTYTGYLTFRGTLELLPAILVAYAGSVIGITVTYLIGNHVGAPLLQQYGKWFFIKPSHLERTRRTYDKYGNKMLFISFFIPGVRQLFGYFVGIIKIPYKTFALYAYPGALIWVCAFIGLGYVFGEQWNLVIRLVEKYIAFFFGGVFILVVLLLAMRWRKWKRWQLRRTEVDKK